jgi:hypothetical protein
LGTTFCQVDPGRLNHTPGLPSSHTQPNSEALVCGLVFLDPLGKRSFPKHPRAIWRWDVFALESLNILPARKNQLGFTKRFKCHGQCRNYSTQLGSPGVWFSLPGSTWQKVVPKASSRDLDQALNILPARKNQLGFTKRFKCHGQCRNA